MRPLSSTLTRMPPPRRTMTPPAMEPRQRCLMKIYQSANGVNLRPCCLTAVVPQTWKIIKKFYEHQMYVLLCVAQTLVVFICFMYANKITNKCNDFYLLASSLAKKHHRKRQINCYCFWTFLKVFSQKISFLTNV